MNRSTTCSKKNRLLYVLAGGLFLLGGCINIKPIQEFTATSLAATNQLPVVASDLSESCIRQKQYAAIREGSFDPLKLRQEAETGCAAFQASEKSFVVANKVLIQYLQTLGRLAGDDIATYDKSLDKLAGSLTETQLVPKAQITTINKVVKFLSGATANGWRRKQLSKAIGEVNPDIQTLLSTLSTIITNDYLQLIQSEQLAAKNLYLATIKENKTKEPVTILLLQQQWDREYKALEGRKKAITAYGQILTTIAQGHQLLFDKRTTLSKKEVLNELGDHTATLVPLIGEINHTF